MWKIGFAIIIVPYVIFFFIAFIIRNVFGVAKEVYETIKDAEDDMERFEEWVKENPAK